MVLLYSYTDRAMNLSLLLEVIRRFFFVGSVLKQRK